MGRKRNIMKIKFRMETSLKKNYMSTPQKKMKMSANDSTLKYTFKRGLMKLKKNMRLEGRKSSWKANFCR